MLVVVFLVLNSPGCSSSLKMEVVPLVQVEMGNAWYKLNTFDGRYIQDADSPESVDTIQFQFTKQEQELIIKLADSLNFWGITN